jgi:hypothetical protein
MAHTPTGRAGAAIDRGERHFGCPKATHGWALLGIATLGLALEPEVHAENLQSGLSAVETLS